MSYALIDNASLTAVQRLYGEVKTKSRDSVDTDILALENYVQSILLYDQIICIDDYMEQYRDERVQKFTDIQFVDKEQYNLVSIEEQARRIADEIVPRIKGGEFANMEFKVLMELLQTHMICTWDISGSIYHLTLKNLSDTGDEFQKYGNLAASIFTEISDAQNMGVKTFKQIDLVDRYGNPVKKGYKVPKAKWGSGESTGEASPAIKAFVAALVWLANRTIFYSQTAKYLQADTFLYPIRQAYQQYYISQTSQYGLNFTKEIVNEFSKSASLDLLKIHSSNTSAITSTSIPVFSAWLARETGDPARIIESAYGIRNDDYFVQIRNEMSEVRKLFNEDNLASANKLASKKLEEIRKISREIQIKYGLKTRQGIPMTKIVQVYNAFSSFVNWPELPEAEFKIKIPEFFYDLKAKKGFSALYRNISEDLSTVWSLGEARDILGSKVVKDRDALSYNPKQELPQYRDAHSPWKSPM